MDKDYIYIRNDSLKIPSISSHTLVNLNNLNKYSTTGRTLLQLFGLLDKKKTEIEPYQEHKGGIVEVFASRYLREQYGERINLEDYTVKQFANYNQFYDEENNNPDSPNYKVNPNNVFTGVLDKLMREPIKIPIEVKSKEIREYERIVEHGIYPKDQLLQGNNQGVLANADQYMMLYGFITKPLKDYLTEVFKRDLWIWKNDYAQAVEDLGIKYTDIIFHHKVFDTDERIVKAYRKKALDLYNNVIENRRIPRSAFNASELLQIKNFINKTNT